MGDGVVTKGVELHGNSSHWAIGEAMKIKNSLSLFLAQFLALCSSVCLCLCLPGELGDELGIERSLESLQKSGGRP